MPDRRTGRASRRPLTRPPADLPTGPLPIPSGTVELRRDRDRPAAVTVLVNGVPSSHLDLDDPTWLEFEYMQQMVAVLEGMPPGPLDAVHLGAGGCALPRWVEATRPGSTQLAVDIDAELLTLVRRWFDLPRSPRLRLRAGDARTVLGTLADASADVVVRDVFAGDQTPPHLCTAEFLEQVSRVLRPGGVYLANCADRPPLGLARAELATADAVFADVALAAEPGQLKGRRYGNLLVAAVVSADAGPDLAGPALERRLRSLPVPVRLLHGPQARAFVGGAAVLRDPAVLHDPAG
ncbi:spermidine synthase [Actinotalea subterranea]|uniref:spermidine synthase n=1 Tax=Actinotalea subterranea TaxID=2607497 RepID=UPI0011EBB9E8|nr:fused MFS/spermidine synthase [Actinotalea subterranea]